MKRLEKELEGERHLKQKYQAEHREANDKLVGMAAAARQLQQDSSTTTGSSSSGGGGGGGKGTATRRSSSLEEAAPPVRTTSKEKEPVLVTSDRPSSDITSVHALVLDIADILSRRARRLVGSGSGTVVSPVSCLTLALRGVLPTPPLRRESLQVVFGMFCITLTEPQLDMLVNFASSEDVHGETLARLFEAGAVSGRSGVEMVVDEVNSRGDTQRRGGGGGGGRGVAVAVATSSSTSSVLDLSAGDSVIRGSMPKPLTQVRRVRGRGRWLSTPIHSGRSKKTEHETCDEAYI